MPFLVLWGPLNVIYSPTLMDDMVVRKGGWHKGMLTDGDGAGK